MAAASLSSHPERVSDLQLSLKRKSSTMKRFLSTVAVGGLMVGICTTSSLPLTTPTRSSFSKTAARFCCHTENARMEQCCPHDSLAMLASP